MTYSFSTRIVVCMISKRNKIYNMPGETSKCQNLNSLFREINFLQLPKYSWNLQMLAIIEKLFLLKNSWKLACLARQFEKWHVFGTLAHKNEMMARFWNVGTHGTRFSKLIFKCFKNTFAKNEWENPLGIFSMALSWCTTFSSVLFLLLFSIFFLLPFSIFLLPFYIFFTSLNHFFLLLFIIFFLLPFGFFFYFPSKFLNFPSEFFWLPFRVFFTSLKY